MRKRAKQNKEKEVRRIFRILADGVAKPERHKLKKLVRNIVARDLRVS
jgi:hypothetical protein